MQKKFPRTFEALDCIVQFAREFFTREAIDPRFRYAVDFALEEIFTNMVKYHPGNPNEILISLDRADHGQRVPQLPVSQEAFRAARRTARVPRAGAGRGHLHVRMAAILDLPEKTVKSRLFSARQLLRDALVRQGIRP